MIIDYVSRPDKGQSR